MGPKVRSPAEEILVRFQAKGLVLESFLHYVERHGLTEDAKAMVQPLEEFIAQYLRSMADVLPDKLAEVEPKARIKPLVFPKKDVLN